MRNSADVSERAELHEEKGNYVEAERLYKKALVLKSKETGEESFELVPYLYNLGMTQFATDKHDDALTSFNRLLNLLTLQQAQISGEINEVRYLINEVYREQDEEAMPISVSA